MLLGNVSPADVLGRRIDQLGSVQGVNLALAGFRPIFTCGDRQFPAVDNKYVAICFVGLSNISSLPPGGGCTFTFGIPTSPAAWGSFFLTQLVDNTGNTACASLPNAGFAQTQAFTSGTVFGVDIITPGAGSCDFTAYGWAE